MRRLLFVADACSLHTVRWISQVCGTEWDVHLFSTMYRGLHPGLKNITVYSPWSCARESIPAGVTHRRVATWPLPRGSEFAKRHLPRLYDYFRDVPTVLARLIRRVKPDVVHALKMQDFGYDTHAALALLPPAKRPPWIYSCWGSDLKWFMGRPEHSARILAVLADCDYICADCQRDLRLARDQGFQGECIGEFPGGGGYDLDSLSRLKAGGLSSSRRLIVVKGQHDRDWTGRALVAIRAIHQCAPALRDYEVVVLAASDEVQHVAGYVAALTGLHIQAYATLSQAEVLQFMAKARVALALATCDGTPNFMLEAMLMGALPIQSDTAAVDEWIEDGVNGLVVPPEDPDRVAVALRRALADDVLVDRAAKTNAQIARQRLDATRVRPQVVAMYERVVAQGSRRKRPDVSP